MRIQQHRSVDPGSQRRRMTISRAGSEAPAAQDQTHTDAVAEAAAAFALTLAASVTGRVPSPCVRESNYYCIRVLERGSSVRVLGLDNLLHIDNFLARVYADTRRIR